MTTSGSLLLLLHFVSPIGAQTGMRERTQKGTIEGTVKAADTERPLAAAEVFITNEDTTEPPLVVSTDSSGHYIVDDLEPGRYFVTVVRRGYLPSQFSQHGKSINRTALTLLQGEKLDRINFALVPTVVIAGRVLGEDNEPRVGAVVQALTARYIEGQRRLIVAGQATTNDLGDYRIYGLAPGHYYVCASDQEGHQTIRQPRGARPEQRYVPTFYPSVINFDEAAIVDVQPGRELSGIDVTAVKSHTFHIRGKVLGFGPTAEYTRVQLRAVEEQLGIVHSGRDIAPDGQGRFDFGGILPGSYVICTSSAQKGNFNYAWQTIEVVNSDINDVNLAPGVGMRLSGRVLVEGHEKIDLGKLSTDLLNPNSPVHPWAQVKSDGSFVFYAVGPYVYRIRVSGLPEDFYLESVRLGKVEVVDATVDLGSAEGSPGAFEIVVSGSGARIDGAVRNERGEPASGASVVLVPDSAHSGNIGLFKETTADQNGHFTIRGIRPGDYTLFALDNVEPGAWWDPEFLGRFQDKGEKVKIGANGSERRDLHLILGNPE